MLFVFILTDLFIYLFISELYKVPAVKPATLEELAGLSTEMGLKCTEDDLKDFRGISLFQKIIYMCNCVLLL